MKTMKHILAVAALLVLVLTPKTVAAQQKYTQKDIDALSYVLGISQTQGLTEYLTTKGVTANNKSDFLMGLRHEVRGVVTDDISKLSGQSRLAYDLGKNVGTTIKQAHAQLNHDLFEGTSSYSISLRLYVQGFIDAVEHRAKYSPEQAREMAGQQMEKIRSSVAEQKYAENKKAGEAFLAANKQKPGVVTLPSGLQYKVIKAGNGAKPTSTSKVKCHYEGRTIDGNVFDSSYKRDQPLEFQANQVIKGWTEALVSMPAGSVWEVYIPQELAYGWRQAGDIKPFSTLIFKMELISFQ